MLRDLTIKNYRAFKDFSIDGLARVNLIVGQNNAGKTSFLESVYLLVNQHSPAVLLQLLDQRGEYAFFSDAPGRIEYQTAQLFNDFQLSIEQVRPMYPIEIVSQQDKLHSVTFGVTSRRSSLGSPQPGLQIDVAYSAPVEKAALALDIGDNYFFSSDSRFTALRRPPSRYHFVSTAVSEPDYLASLWDRISQNPSEEYEVVTALQIVDPAIEDLRFASQQTAGRALVKLQGRQERFPLSSLGEGLRRVLSLAMHAIVSEKGVLLVDEIDTGLYYGVQVAFWRFLIQTAKRLNTQIFATTHSQDCVEAFQEALQESDEPEDRRLFRLQRHGERIYAVDYSARDLRVAVTHGIEVR